MNEATQRGVTWGAVIVVIVGILLWASAAAKPSPSDLTFDPVDLQMNQADASEHVRGNPDAPYMLIEYSDYQCPFCRQYAAVVEQVLQTYPDQVKLVYRNFPLRSAHPYAQLAAQAAEAAGAQGKYFEYHDLLFANQEAWSKGGGARDKFVQYATALGLDTVKFEADMDSQAVKDKVNNDYTSGLRVNVNATPTFFLNGERLTAPQGYEGLVAALVAAGMDANPDGPAAAEESSETASEEEITEEATNDTP